MNGEAETKVAEKIEAALQRVFDPCSLAAQAALSVLDMGLVLGWKVDEEDNLTVRMCVTSPCCTLAPNIARGAEQELRKIPELASVRVQFDAGTFWTAESMSERGREILQQRRQESQARTPVRPQQWRGRAASVPLLPQPFTRTAG